jgi:hypothetical protein
MVTSLENDDVIIQMTSLESLENGVMHGNIVMQLVKCDAIGKMVMSLVKW